MLKKGILAIGALLLLGVLFLGRDVASYVATSAGWMQDRVKESVPIKFELERARKMIADLAPEISRHKREIAHEELDLNKLRDHLQKDEDQLAKGWDDIQRLRGDLSRNDSNYIYAGVSYTSAQVENDLTGRFERFQVKEGTIGNMQKIYDARRRGLDAAQAELKEMIAAKGKLALEVENLEARLKMVEVAKAASELNIDDSQLSRTRELLSDIEARIEVDAQLVNASDIVLDEIPLEEPDETANILDRITDYESAKDAPATFVGYED